MFERGPRLSARSTVCSRIISPRLDCGGATLSPPARAPFSAERLEERIARAEALAQQAIAGQRSVKGAIATRASLRGEIADTLALLAALTRQAAGEQPELAAGIARPDSSASNQSFLTRNRVATATALANRELLQCYGMPESFPEDLGRMLEEFEAVLNEKHAGRSAQVGAHADLYARYRRGDGAGAPARRIEPVPFPERCGTARRLAQHAERRLARGRPARPAGEAGRRGGVREG